MSKPKETAESNPILVEAGRKGGLKSRGGGRPKKYQTEEERKAAAVARTLAWRKRKKI